MEEKTKAIVKFIRFLDEGRWLSHRNYDIPNYADKKMPPDQKLLTHFLGYITNRQISYKLIFSKLDFIFSQLIKDYYSDSSAYKLLLYPGTYIDCENGEKKGFKACRLMDDWAQYSEDKSLPRQELIKASSRFFPNDVVGIFCTLKVLTHFTEKSFSVYIRKCLSLATSEHEMEFLLYGLWLLGYSTGQWKKNDLDYQKIYDRCLKQRFDAVKNFFDGGGVPVTFRKERYKCKRLTCFVRDLFKCEHYIFLFQEIISPQVMKKLQNQLHVLELPGDVWNNNEHFRECFCTCSGMDQTQKRFNEMIRDFYENYVWKKLGLEKSDYYPEQFDTTFDFVPRMCDKNGQTNCQYCPVRHGDGKIAEEFCIAGQNENKFCPFLLYACGYQVLCQKMKNCPNKHWIGES